MFKKSRRRKEDAELDVTSFMSLMIVLVPVLLMMMVFSHISILELKFPNNLAEKLSAPNENQQLELLVNKDSLQLFYPAGALLTTIPQIDKQHDYAQLLQSLKEIKFLLSKGGVSKKDINLLLAPKTDYQTIVTLMDVVRSYETVVAASVVDAELFPEISLSDAPLPIDGNSEPAIGEEAAQ